MIVLREGGDPIFNTLKLAEGFWKILLLALPMEKKKNHSLASGHWFFYCGYSFFDLLYAIFKRFQILKLIAFNYVLEFFHCFFIIFERPTVSSIIMILKFFPIIYCVFWNAIVNISKPISIFTVYFPTV